MTKRMSQNLRYLDSSITQLTPLKIGCDLYSGATYTLANTVHVYFYSFDIIIDYIMWVWFVGVTTI